MKEARELDKLVTRLNEALDNRMSSQVLVESFWLVVIIDVWCYWYYIWYGILGLHFFKFIVQASAYFDIGHNYFLISSVHTFDADGYTTS